MSEGLQQIGRLAIREVKDEVRFYYAMPDTIKGAVLLMTVQANLIRGKPQHLTRLIAAAREMVGDIIEEKAGVRPVWPTPPQPAPEHERGVKP